MREVTPGPASLSVEGLRRRFVLTEEDRFDWTLPPTWAGKEDRPSKVLAVQMVPGWRGAITVTLECHVIRKDGQPSVNGSEYRLGTHVDLDRPGIPVWVRDEHRALTRLHEDLEAAAAKVLADHAGATA